MIFRKIYRIFILPYTIFLLYLMFLGFVREQHEANIVRLLPFVSTILFVQNTTSWKSIIINLFGNIIGFAPLGFLLPSFSGRCRKYWYNTVMAGYLLSFGVELVQLLLRAGSCDIDDVILNTTGTLLGYCCFRLVQRKRKKRRQKREL